MKTNSKKAKKPRARKAGRPRPMVVLAAAEKKPALRKRQIIVYSLAVFFLLVLAAGTHFISQTAERQKLELDLLGDTLTPTAPVDLSQWQAYSNTKYNYSFKYPSYLSLGEDTKQLAAKEQSTGLPLVETTDTFGLTGYSPAFTDAYLSLYVFVNSGAAGDCATLAACVDEYNQSIAGLDDWQIAGQSQIKFLGQDVAAEKINRREAGWSHLLVFFYQNNNFYTLRFTANYDKYDQVLPELKQILDTFEFKN